jgi:tRNA dimethylallyltransferase
VDKVIAVVGPTASGKSVLAVEIAKAVNGEVISADSMQVYKEMDIGTAKITEAEMQKIPHHLIDIISYQTPWNVKEFQSACRSAIADITARGKVPVLCGGTGLYVKAALYDYDFPDEPENTAVKEELEKLSNEQLYAFLKKEDPGALEKIHINNRKRLLRAALLAKSDKNKTQREKEQQHAPVYDIYFAGLFDPDRNREISRIDDRVRRMFDAGLVQEVQDLFSDPDTRRCTSFAGIGYKEFADFFEGKADLDQIQSNIALHTRQYSKRQMTWFRNQMPVHWFEVGDVQKVIEEVRKWL